MDKVEELYEEYKSSDKSLWDFCVERGIQDAYHKIRRVFKRLEKGWGTPSSRKVAEAVQKDIAKNAENLTKAHLELGRAVWNEIADAAAKEGIPPSELDKYPAVERIHEWRVKAEEYEEMRRKYEEMRELVERYSPLEHALNVTRLVNETAVALGLLRRAGFRISRNSSVVRFLNSQIVKYSGGVGG
jgi:phosphoglycolate phosphatase-like HAD superfamily hydrolase